MLFSELKTALKGRVLLPEDDFYAGSVKLWNAAIHTHPAIIVRCEDSSDVTTAVRIARKYNWNLTVKGGGHDWSGLALSEDGIVIDMSGMRGVKIDTEKKEATIEGGVTAGDLLTAADPFGLVAVTGAGSTIGMAGLTMGGGYGPLTPKYGLALDNLISAVIVLADGQMLTASETEHRDLFWALKGGGGNFGVVVSMRVRLYDAHTVLSALLLFPMSHAGPVLQYYNECARSAPDELSLITGIVPAAGAGHAVTVALTWCGDIETGERFFADLQPAGKPFSAQVQRMKYKDLLSVFDTFVIQDHYNDMKTRWLPDLTAKALSIILKAAAEMTSPLSTVSLQYFYGAPARVPLHSTAFGLRQPHILVLITSTWRPEDDKSSAIHQKWSKDLCDDLAAQALPGGYANVLTPKEPDQVLFAHGENLAELQRVKDSFDPERIFTSYPIGLLAPAREKIR